MDFEDVQDIKESRDSAIELTIVRQKTTMELLSQPIDTKDLLSFMQSGLNVAAKDDSTRDDSIPTSDLIEPVTSSGPKKKSKLSYNT